MFEKLVAEGKLPPVEERLPENPRVIDPLDSIGTYGGTAHVYTNSPFWPWNGELAGLEWLLTINSDLTWGTPNVLESVEVSEDASSYVLHLRKGLKWSDGVEFTAEDFEFHWNFVMKNTDLYPTMPAFFAPQGIPMVLTARDDYTVYMDFASPYSLWFNYLSGGGACPDWQWWFGMFQPAHYCKQFHPAFIGQEVANQRATDAGFADWTQWYWYMTYLFFGQQDRPYTEVPPTLMAYVCVERTLDQVVYERNPYFWKVDTAGNQLPYIDRIVNHIVESTEVINGKIISGEVDIQWILTEVDQLPVYKDNEELGGYEARLWDEPTSVFYQLNLTHPDPVIREIFWDVRFRQALSLAMDRQEIIESVFLGLGTARSFTVPNESPYFREGFDTYFTEHNPEEASRLLDEMGLDQRDAEGFRLRPDGERLSLTIEVAETGPMDELIRLYWRDIGLDIDLKGVTQDLLLEHVSANSIDIMGNAGGEFNVEPAFSTLPQFYVPLTNTWPGLWANQWATYYLTEGASGMEPPPEIQQLFDWYEEIQNSNSPEARIEPAQNILQSHADNVWQLGICGALPAVVIVKSDMKNVPQKALMTWDLTRMVPYNPSQFYFEGREAILEPWPGRFE